MRFGVTLFLLVTLFEPTSAEGATAGDGTNRNEQECKTETLDQQVDSSFLQSLFSCSWWRALERTRRRYRIDAAIGCQASLP